MVQNSNAQLVARSRRPYWQAQGLVEQARFRFETALSRDDTGQMLDAYYWITRYYARTLTILPEALAERREELALTVLQNVLVLEAALESMHLTAPQVVPLAMPLTEDFYDQYLLGLIIRVFEESPGDLAVEQLADHMSQFQLIGAVDTEDLVPYVSDLLVRGVLEERQGRLRRTRMLFLDLSIAEAILHTLLGPELTRRLEAEGFQRLQQVTSRPKEFIATFRTVTGMCGPVGALLVDVAVALQDVQSTTHAAYHHRDLIHSGVPRPYQMEAYGIFRGFGYQGVLIEAPTGSGKTLIGMMCVQDWLPALVPGESVLVLVPSNNYQQQWVRELCYNPIGLDLSPEVVFAGTPSDLERYQRRAGDIPAVIIMTYAGLAQLSRSDGEFQPAAVSDFLASNGVREVILSEAHKVAEDLNSVTATVVRELVRHLEAGDLSGLIGFSGTATAYHERFERLGLRLVHVIPMVELVASGFVAPFAEFGVPFAYSERERSIRVLLEQYKDLIRKFIDLAGSGDLRRRFATVPLAERVAIARDLLGMYDGRDDVNELVASRLRWWEQGEEITLADAPLISILQIATGQSDGDLIRPERTAELDGLFAEADRIRDGLLKLMFLPATVALLERPSLDRQINAADFQALLADPNQRRRRSQVRLLLGATLVGLYDGLKNWYQYMGEGRVTAVRAIMRAEADRRAVSGVIVFDEGRRIRWEQGTVTPGFDGVGGLFAEVLGDPTFRPLAALSREMYLPWDPQQELPNYIAGYIESVVMREEVGQAIHDLLVAGMALGEPVARRFQTSFSQVIHQFVASLSGTELPRFSSFVRTVLRPLRREFGHQRAGISRAVAARFRQRLSLRNTNLRALLITFFDYAALARRWRAPHTAELVQASGQRQPFFVVPMPGGRRKQLMYDLVARIVDDENLPVNLVIVSQWARTGWNVINPNVLIDATATRDETAWQQLRGRAMRARRSWTNDCYRAQSLLLGSRALRQEISEQQLPPDVRDTLSDLAAAVDSIEAMPEPPARILRGVLNPEQRSRFAAGNLEAFSLEERSAIAAELMQRYNKVTHIYELVRATGAEPQITFHRGKAAWVRRDEIAQKHDHEVSVDLNTERVVRGDVHAPLLYGDDPRRDAPAALEAAVAEALANGDDSIVTSWVRAADEPSN